MSEINRDKLNRMHPTFQEVKAGDMMVYAPVIFTYDQTAAANAAAQTVFTAPFPLRIVDVLVEGKNAEAAVVTLDNGTTPICTAITAANQALIHMTAGVVTAELEFDTGDVLTMQTGHANARCRVTVIAIRK
jgi:transaldolase